ncbi:ATP-binding protein [Streptomyces sp. NPDC002476]|uniref:ATP-binding protein n=1 Tax=Streptomyces sp. NPDC002476 TaxID=3364648 RepID=UPI00367E3B62
MVSATVSPPWTYTLQLPRDPRAPGVARAMLRSALRLHGMPELVENAEMLASELVTNAYLHSSGPYSLRLRKAGRGRIRLGVRDTSPHIPAPFRRSAGVPAELAERGRGLYLVTLYAESWGAVPLSDGGVGGGGRPERAPQAAEVPDRSVLSGQGGKLLWVECVAKGEGEETVAGADAEVQRETASGLG